MVKQQREVRGDCRGHKGKEMYLIKLKRGEIETWKGTQKRLYDLLSIKQYMIDHFPTLSHGHSRPALAHPGQLVTQLSHISNPSCQQNTNKHTVEQWFPTSFVLCSPTALLNSGTRVPFCRHHPACSKCIRVQLNLDVI